MENINAEYTVEELISFSKSETNENKILVLEIEFSIKNILNDLGIFDFSDYCFQIDLYAIRHIFKQHGDIIKEESRGQKIVEDDDIKSIVEIINFPDKIHYDGKSKSNKDIFIFEKEQNHRKIVIFEVREGKKRLALHSMRIYKQKKNQS